MIWPQYQMSVSRLLGSFIWIDRARGYNSMVPRSSGEAGLFREFNSIMIIEKPIGVVAVAVAAATVTNKTNFG